MHDISVPQKFQCKNMNDRIPTARGITNSHGLGLNVPNNTWIKDMGSVLLMVFISILFSGNVIGVYKYDHNCPW